MAVNLGIHNLLDVATVADALVRDTSPHHQGVASVLDVQVKMVRMEGVARSNPAVFHPIGAPDVDFSFIGKDDLPPVFYRPRTVLFGPFQPGSLVSGREEGLFLLQFAQETHRLESAVDSHMRKFEPFMNQKSMNFGCALEGTIQNMTLFGIRQDGRSSTLRKNIIVSVLFSILGNRACGDG